MYFIHTTWIDDVFFPDLYYEGVLYHGHDLYLDHDNHVLDLFP